eukprot:6777935-Prorocentrum_lima.AAC.1
MDKGPRQHVVMLQEHRLSTHEGVDLAKRWCKARGWKTNWARATATGSTSTSTSAGVMVGVRACIGASV